MTNEEIWRRLKAVDKQQENFNVRIELLRESHVRGEARLSWLEVRAAVENNIVSETAELQKEVAQALKELSSAQARTDKRLENLIIAVEQFISDRRNGGESES
ncbi:MAG TPA: hypothetical protein VGB73_17125 [Pyrinomonadaceae bacterium]|jgi:DNA repair ATPase RecN